MAFFAGFGLKLLFGGIPWKSMIGFALKYWKEIAVVTMLATIFYQNTFEKRYVFFINTIPYLELKLEEYEKAIDKIEAANHTLSAAIDKRNSQIEEWKAKSIELEKKNAVLSGQLELLRQLTDQEVEDILAGPTPQSCDAAIDYLRDAIPDLNYIHRGVEE